jgi:hypothetical protein
MSIDNYDGKNSQIIIPHQNINCLSGISRKDLVYFHSEDQGKIKPIVKSFDLLRG